MGKSYKVLVLAGGPDRERPVSLLSGAAVAQALRDAGHQVMERDILPNNHRALTEFAAWGGDVIFPVLHGSWGEGGPLQRILDDRGVAYVGCGAPSAELCMDKHRTKVVLEQEKLPTPQFELVARGQQVTLAPPVVLKAPCEGSSLGMAICPDAASLAQAHAELARAHSKLLVERFIRGMEITVGVLGGLSSPLALPPIHIVPATAFYDYEAKYNRDDTQYHFDIDLPAATLKLIGELATRTYHVLGCRHMCRVDVIVDPANQPWILEVNTIPGFTSHSLLPKAAARIGMPMPVLVDYLIRLALGESVRLPEVA